VESQAPFIEVNGFFGGRIFCDSGGEGSAARARRNEKVICTVSDELLDNQSTPEGVNIGCTTDGVHDWAFKGLTIMKTALGREKDLRGVIPGGRGCAKRLFRGKSRNMALFFKKQLDEF
jgi:hypothetical protein